jgi:UDPglucose 6-dehydrogenase
VRTAAEHARSLKILEAVESVNQAQKRVLVDKIHAKFGADLTGRTFGVWGLAFKPNTDDMRDAPSRVIVAELLRAGARVVAHDPVAAEEARRVLQLDLSDAPALLDRMVVVPKAMEAVDGADALVVCTEWKAYRSPNWTALKAAMKQPLVFDGRNLYEPELLRMEGIEYHGVGRASR